MLECEKIGLQRLIIPRLRFESTPPGVKNMKRRKLKIAFVSFYQGDVNRGVESFVHELATRLSINHDVTVIQRSTSKIKRQYKVCSIPIEMDWNRDDTSDTRARKYFVDYWYRQIGFHALKSTPKIFREKYDIVIPLNNGWQSIIMRFATFLIRSKLVFVGQSGLGWDDRISSYCFPTKYVALTTTQKNWFKKINPLIHVSVIPNGVEISRFENAKDIRVNKLPKPIVLMVAALYDWKRADLAVKAVAKTKASLVLVGEGPEKKNLESLVAKLMPKRAIIRSLDYKDIHRVYKDADVFTYPTDPSESFGIVLLEAMASGLPVVATDDPIRREIVGDAGLFVDPTDTDVYAKAIKKALNTNWGNKPVDQAKKFDWTVIAQKYDDLFQEITK